MKTARLIACLAMLMPAAAWAQQPAPPGQFDYYLLALSWSPAFCADHRNDEAAKEECALHLGLVVHGLWPQDEDGRWPAFCRPVSTVPVGLAKREAGVMPSYELMDHEWHKHGSCTTMEVESYFGTIQRLFSALTLPEPLRDPGRETRLSRGKLKQFLAAANPGMSAASISLQCGRHGSEVHELRLCLDKSFNYRACPADQADACPDEVRLPAVP